MPRLPVMKILLSRLERIYILILWTMIKSVVFVFRNRCLLIFLRYHFSLLLCSIWCLWCSSKSLSSFVATLSEWILQNWIWHLMSIVCALLVVNDVFFFLLRVWLLVRSDTFNWKTHGSILGHLCDTAQPWVCCG